MIGDGAGTSFGGNGGGISSKGARREGGEGLSFMMTVLRRLMLLSRRKGIPGESLDGDVGV